MRGSIRSPLYVSEMPEFQPSMKSEFKLSQHKREKSNLISKIKDKFMSKWYADQTPLNPLPPSFGGKKRVGDAGIDYEIIKTPDNSVSELEKKYGPENIRELIKINNFWTMFLTMYGNVADPTSYMIKHLRFNFNLGDKNITIKSYAPNSNGIKTDIEKNGSRDFNLSLSGKLGASISQTSGNDKNKTIVEVGPEGSAGVLFDDKNGWTVKFEQIVDEFKGYTARKEDGSQHLFYDIYRNNAIAVPKGNIGETMVVYATIIFLIPQSYDEMELQYKADGELGKLKFWTGAGEIDTEQVFKIPLK